MNASPASLFCAELLAEFIRLGVRDVVLSPGSRSQALALAAAAFERRGLLRLRVRIDERVAGFTALGLAIETRTSVLIIATSGTAIANLHPAVLEAHHSGVPLIVLSADRPLELRGIGSNQTTDQSGIFGTAVSRVWDVPAPVGDPAEGEAAVTLAREVMDAAAGPLQVNLAFREPLSSVVPLPDARPGEWVTLQPAHTVELRSAPGTVVVAGHGAGERAESVARALGAPLIAEVSSGAHFGPNLVVAYRELLGRPEFSAPVQRVVVFGHPTLSREVPALIARYDVETIGVRTPGVEEYNPGRRVATFADAVRVSGEPDERSWVGRWVSASRAILEHPEDTSEVRNSGQGDGPDVTASNAVYARQELAAMRAPVTRRALVDAVWRMTWPHDRLVVGASRLIRELDRVAPGKKISVHANRGLAGIDGTIATATGIALASQARGESTTPSDSLNQESHAQGITRVLLGDLALLHDVGALLFGDGEPRPRLQVVVGNDSGGTIFDSLEVATSAPPLDLQRVLYTPQSVRLEPLAAAYGWEYRRATNRGELASALSPSPGLTLVEVPLPR